VSSAIRPRTLTALQRLRATRRIAGMAQFVRLRLCRLVRALGVILVLGVAWGAGCASAAHLPASFFGVNDEVLFSTPQSQWPAQLTEMQNGGVRFVRTDADWGMAESTPPVGGVHTYDWSQFDALVAALASHQLTWFPIIDYSAWWASAIYHDPYAPPRNDSDYAHYANALAQRYGANGVFWQEHPELPYLPVEQWEIWNEENYTGVYWQTGYDPGRYIDLYLAARGAIRSVDPSAKVVVGGLGDGPGSYTSYIARMYQHRPDAKGQIDAIGLHPYPQDEGQTAASSMQAIATLRTYLNSVGDENVPIEITEVGWTTESNGGVADSYRAQQLTQLIDDLAASNEGVTEFMPYAWATDHAVPDYFGMFNSDGTPTLEGTAYLEAIKALTAKPGDGNGGTGGGSRTPAIILSARWLARSETDRVTLKCQRVHQKCSGVLSASILPQLHSYFALLRRKRSLKAQHYSLRGGTQRTVNLKLPPALRRLARRNRFKVHVQIEDLTASLSVPSILHVVAVV